MVEEYDLEATLSIKAKGKTVEEIDNLLEDIKTAVRNLKNNSKIDSGELKVKQMVKDRNWHYPNVQE